MRSTISLTVLGAVLAAAPAIAQSNPAPTPPPVAPVAPPPAPTPPRQRMDVRRPRLFLDDSAYRNRATLGMSLSSTGSKRDTLGVFVTRVVPGGPAERVGIIEGDRIASINDVSLRLSNVDLDDPYAAGLPAHRISRTVEKLTAGNSVRLRVYGNGRFRDVNVTTGKMSDVYTGHDRMMMFSLNGMDGLDTIGPAMSALGPELDKIGPAMERIGPELEKIGPRIRVEMKHAMDEMPRDIHVELDRERSEP